MALPIFQPPDKANVETVQIHQGSQVFSCGPIFLPNGHDCKPNLMAISVLEQNDCRVTEISAANTHLLAYLNIEALQAFDDDE